MFRRGDPVLHDLLELLGRHARVRGHDDLADGLFAAGERAFHVALEQRGKRLLVLPLGCCGASTFDAVEREEELEIHRLLGPERAVVVERGDASRRAARSLASLLLVTFVTKVDDGLLALPSFHDGSGSADCAIAVVNVSTQNSAAAMMFCLRMIFIRSFSF